MEDSLFTGHVAQQNGPENCLTVAMLVAVSKIPIIVIVGP